MEGLWSTLSEINFEVQEDSALREALVRLNPEIAVQPDRADEVIYNLRACILSVQADGLVRANENFMAWVRGEKSMPFGRDGEHVPVRLIDAESAADKMCARCLSPPSTSLPKPAAS